MKFIYNKKILVTILISMLCIMVFNVRVFAENTTTETDTSIEETTDSSEAAGDDDTTTETEEKIFALDKEELDVRLNGTGYLSYTGRDYSQEVTWTSSDPTVATVKNGIITGLKIGTTTITATNGTQTASCEVNVIYSDIQIGANGGESVSEVNLVLGENERETLTAKVEDAKTEEVKNAQIEWESSDSSIVTVGKTTGELKALKAGTATITATAAGVSDTCEITVYSAPEFTDFSKAKYELLFDTDTDLKISGITPKDDAKNSYRFIITSSKTKPTLLLDKNGSVNYEQDGLEYLVVNSEENYMYSRNLNEYVELNQDLYLWVIQQVRLDGSYVDEEQNSVSYSTKMVVEGEKLTRPELPQLNLILNNFSIWGGFDQDELNDTSMNFRFPSATENRKFTVKIGKVTDYEILKKIQNNDYSGITELLEYSKNNKAVYTSNLTATNTWGFDSEQPLFDGKSILTDDAYYYIYVMFDDENGKYYPIEGITLGQANVSDYSDIWYLYAYTSDKFEWNNLTPTYTPTEPSDTTTAPTVIPNAGSKMIIAAIMLIIVSVSIVFYKKCNKFKDII